jgi:hypothetical protein
MKKMRVMKGKKWHFVIVLAKLDDNTPQNYFFGRPTA